MGEAKAKYGYARVAALPLMLLAPWIVAGTYLYFSRLPQLSWSGASDMAMLAVAIGLGLAGVALLRVRLLPKAVIALVYVPVVGVLLVLFSLFFVGGVPNRLF
jgi:hypothetical protein